MPSKAPTKKSPTSKSTSTRSHTGDQGDITLLLSLAGGSRAYVCYPRGRSTSVATSSPEFYELVATMVAVNLGERVRKEVSGFATRWPRSHWPHVLADLEEKQLLSATA
jgi:hypothetical protein